MNLRTLICTESDCYKAGKKITPVGIVVHSTGANNPALKRYVNPDDGLLGENKYNNHWNVPGKDVCPHAAIGKLADGSVATYQLLPWDHRSWTAGKGKNGSANATHIQFEICEDDLESREYFEAVYREALEFCAYLCRMLEINPLKDGAVIDHKEAAALGIASNHGDIAHWWPKFGKSMETFREELAQLLRQAPEASQPEEIPFDGTVQAEHFDSAKRRYYTTTANSGLRLRIAPEDGTVIEVLAKGEKVFCTGGYTGSWLRVETEGSRVGFCHSAYLTGEE